MNVLVIHELSTAWQEHAVLGVVDSVEKAMEVINDYYGKYEEVKHTDLSDYPDMVWTKIIIADNNKYEVTLQWFELNKI